MAGLWLWSPRERPVPAEIEGDPFKRHQLVECGLKSTVKRYLGDDRGDLGRLR